MKFNIAVVQFAIKQFSPIDNLKKAEKFIKKASKKASVIVFPEDFITGPILGNSKFVDFNKKYSKHFQKLAKQYSIDIVTGSFIEGDGKDWFNTTYYIDAKGKIKGRYRKINLWHPERRYLKPGNLINIFHTKYGKTGLIICWDLIYPEVFREMVKKGVKIVYCPSFWTKQDAGIGMKYDKDAEIKSVNSLCTTRAFENEIVLVYVNAAEKIKTGKISDDLIGQSQITVPFKGVLKKLEHNKEQMFIQEVDSAIIEDAEKEYKIRKDLQKMI